MARACLLVALTLAGACGDNTDTPWHDVQLGTELDDQLWGLAVDGAGALYIAGYEHGHGYETNIEPDGDSRGVVVKIDPTGDVAWTAALDTPGTDTVEDVAIDPATGHVFAIGRTSGAFPGFANGGQFDEVVAELDPQGGVAQLLQRGDELPEHPARLALDGDGALLVAGYDDMFVEGNAVLAFDDGFVQRFARDPIAAPTVHEAVSSTALNRMTAVVAAPDGSGAFYVSGFLTGGPRPGPYVDKRARDGRTLWSTRISPVSFDLPNALALSPTGEVLVAGGTLSLLGAEALGQEDAFVLALDPDSGAVAWASQVGTAQSDVAVGIAVGPDGHIYLAGMTFGSVADPAAPAHADLDPFALELDPRGAVLARWQGGVPAVDELVTAMAVDGRGHVAVGGFSAGPLGGDDMFVVRADLR